MWILLQKLIGKCVYVCAFFPVASTIGNAIYCFILLCAALCNKDSKFFGMLNTMGLVTPPHRESQIFIVTICFSLCIVGEVLTLFTSSFRPNRLSNSCGR